MFGRVIKYIKRVPDTVRNEAVVKRMRSEDKELISRIRANNLTYLSKRKLTSIATTCRSIENSNLPGVVIEAGCALGGSAILMASIKTSTRPLFIYDVFGTIPPPTREDPEEVHDRYEVIISGESKGLGGDTYYGYQDNLLNVVESNIDDFKIDRNRENINLIKGCVQDTLFVNSSVALAHIDVDWYEPVKTCLERIVPRIVTGGSVIIDDYHDWGGCRKAVDEYMQDFGGRFLSDDSAGSLKLTKVK